MKQFVINCTRNGILFNNTESNTPTWTECEALLSNSCVPKMHTSFLPYIPHPVTEFSTVYTALKNFPTVLSQLNQTRVPVFCDEGVYRIVADITHQKKDEFSGITPLLGFHMAKAAQHSIRKLIKHTGLDDALVETGQGVCQIFFPNFQVFKGFFSIFWLFFKVFGEIFAYLQDSSKNPIRMFVSIYWFRKLPNEH